MLAASAGLGFQDGTLPFWHDVVRACMYVAAFSSSMVSMSGKYGNYVQELCAIGSLRAETCGENGRFLTEFLHTSHHSPQ